MTAQPNSLTYAANNPTGDLFGLLVTAKVATFNAAKLSELSIIDIADVVYGQDADFLGNWRLQVSAAIVMATVDGESWGVEVLV